MVLSRKQERQGPEDPGKTKYKYVRGDSKNNLCWDCLVSFCSETAGLHENSPPRLRRGSGAQRRRGGVSCRSTDTGLAFPGLFEPARRGLWLTKIKDIEMLRRDSS